MTTKIRPARNGKGWEYDIRFRWPEGGTFRERKDAPVASKSAAKRWAEAREASLLADGKAAHERKPALKVRAPTLDEFWPRVVRDHYVANRKKASTASTAAGLYKNHIGPALGSKPLDQILTADIAALKGSLSSSKPKSVNNVLSVLSRALRCAIEWDVITSLPCKFGLLKVVDPEMDWYEVHDYRRLVDAARLLEREVLLVVLLAGSAGLRRGEIKALKWTDIDFARKLVHVRRGMWEAVEDTTKGGRSRKVDLTDELVAALKAHRHLNDRVIYSLKERELSNRTIRNWMGRAQRRAGLPVNGRIHVLRHTFCSHLAIAGVPAKAIQELAGHADLKTTMRYMHLSPANRSAAIAALSAYHEGVEKQARKAG